MTLKEIVAEDSPFYATVKWVADFKRARDSTEDDPRSGHPKTSITYEQINVVCCMVLED